MLLRGRTAVISGAASPRGIGLATLGTDIIAGKLTEGEDVRGRSAWSGRRPQ
jgi:hypothetical protein